MRVQWIFRGPGVPLSLAPSAIFTYMPARCRTFGLRADTDMNRGAVLRPILFQGFGNRQLPAWAGFSGLERKVEFALPAPISTKGPSGTS